MRTLDKQKESGYNSEKDKFKQRLVEIGKCKNVEWVKETLEELTVLTFCGNIQVNFHQGTITGIQVTDFKKPPV